MVGCVISASVILLAYVLLAESIFQEKCPLTCVGVGENGKPNWYVEFKLNLLRTQRKDIGHGKTTWQVSPRGRSRICIYSQIILENPICMVGNKQGVTNGPTGSVIRPVFIVCSTKPKWGRSRISYYSNTSATFNCTLSAILICGDVHPHPGPESQIPVRITSRRNLSDVPSRSRAK